MADSVLVIEEAIRTLEGQLAALRDALSVIKGSCEIRSNPTAHGLPRVSPPRFSHMRVGAAVRAYLHMKRPFPATIDELETQLRAGGYEFGRSPSRDIKNGINQSSEFLERREDGLVYLKE